MICKRRQVLEDYESTITETIVLTLAAVQTQTHTLYMTMNLGKTLVITVARTMNHVNTMVPILEPNALLGF